MRSTARRHRQCQGIAFIVKNGEIVDEAKLHSPAANNEPALPRPWMI